jgi:phospholipid transport system substrate-binding protein
LPGVVQPPYKEESNEHAIGLVSGRALDDAWNVLRLRGDLKMMMLRTHEPARPLLGRALDPSAVSRNSRLTARRPVVTGWLRLLAFLPMLSAAAQPTPAEVVRNSVEGLRAAIQRDEAAIAQDPARVIPLIREYVIPHVDTEVFAKLILGQHWQSASEAQRVAFTLAFADALLRLYGVHVSQFTDAKVAYLGAFPVGDNPNAVLVRTRVSSNNGPPREVDYRMMLRNGAWKAIDASVDGISIVRTYRAALNEEIRRVGIGGAVQRLSRSLTIH